MNIRNFVIKMTLGIRDDRCPLFKIKQSYIDLYDCKKQITYFFYLL